LIFFYVRDPVDLNRTGGGEIKIHTKIDMFMTTYNVEFFIVSVISLSQPIRKGGNNGGIDVTNKEVINVSANCHLLAIDDFVGHTRVVRIDFKTQGKEVSGKFSIK